MGDDDDGRAAALRVEHVTGLEVAVPIGRRIEALPEGNRYLGFLFARAEHPAEAEAALRAAHELLEAIVLGRGEHRDQVRDPRERVGVEIAGDDQARFVVRRQSNGEIAGITRFKSLSREHRKALVGSWYRPSAWGSGCNTEGKLLLMEYGFEQLHCLRIEFQVDSRNRRLSIF